MAYNYYYHTAVLLLGAISVVICIENDGSSTIKSCVYNLKCETSFQGKKCHNYSSISIDPKEDCTTVIYPTNTECQSATPSTTTSSACHPSSGYTAYSICTCNTVTSTLTTTMTITTTTITTTPPPPPSPPPTTTTTTTAAAALAPLPSAALPPAAAVVVEATCNCSSTVPDTLPATLHGVYMTVLLVLVAVTITMTTLVVYMCLMMRRAKSGRVPQTTTGTTHTNNMAASDYCEPISPVKCQQTKNAEKVGQINREEIYTQPVDSLQHLNSAGSCQVISDQEVYTEPIDTLQKQHRLNRNRSTLSAKLQPTANERKLTKQYSSRSCFAQFPPTSYPPLPPKHIVVGDQEVYTEPADTLHKHQRLSRNQSTSSVKLESKTHEKRKLTKQYSSGSGYLQPPPPPSYTPLPPNSFSDTVFTDLNLTHEHTPLDDHEYATLDQVSNDRGKTHNEVNEK